MIRSLWPLAACLTLASCRNAAPPSPPPPAAPGRPAPTSVPPASSPSPTAFPPALSAPAPEPAQTPAPTFNWPVGLTRSLVRVEVLRTRPGQAPRSAKVFLDQGTRWLMESPRRGEADPEALQRLNLALDSPLLVAPGAAPARFDDPVEFDLTLTSRSKKATHLQTLQAPLGQPIPVIIDGVSRFLVSPVEFATKVPDPDDFLPPGLWVNAALTATSLKVQGPASYRLVREAGEWKSPDGRASARDLDDFPGVILGRQAMSHPEADLRALGLAAPVATATMCAGQRCLAFKFGKVDGAGTTRYYAQAPEADPIELRASDWNLLVAGPWGKVR